MPLLLILNRLHCNNYQVYHTESNVPGKITENLVEVGELCVTAVKWKSGLYPKAPM